MSVGLGDKIKDNITGLEGICTSRTEYLYGCVHIGLTPEKLDKDGKPADTSFFDEQRVEVVKSAKPKVSKDSEAKSGGPAILGRPSARGH